MSRTRKASKASGSDPRQKLTGDFVTALQADWQLHGQEGGGMGGFFKKGSPEEIAVQEDVSSRKGVERIIRYAFEYARSNRRKSVCMSDKNNIMRFGGDLWLRTFEDVAKEYPDIEHFHMFVDALSMQMVRAATEPR